MLSSNLAIAAVEIAHHAGADMGGADGKARLAAVDEIEIDQFAKRLLQRGGRIISGVLGAERIEIAGMRQRIGPKEARDAVGHRCPVGELLVEAGEDVAKVPDRVLLHPLPELA